MHTESEAVLIEMDFPGPPSLLPTPQDMQGRLANISISIWCRAGLIHYWLVGDRVLARILTLPMLRLFSSIAQGCKDF